MKPPGPNEKCLCGSNLKFKKCCSAFLPKSIGDMHDKYISCWKNKDFKAALRAARADITKYTICHRSHTLVALRNGFEYAPHLFEVDIDALADYVDFLRNAYWRLDRIDEFPAVLERLRSNISAPRWNQKIIYFQTLCALGPDWNVDAGKREIRKLGLITDIGDPEVLALYLNLIRNELSLDENLRLIEKICSTSSLLSTKVHQSAVKANLLFSHNDFKGAIRTLGEAIEELEEEEEHLDHFQRDKYAHCLFMLATLGIDSSVDQDVETATDFLKRSEEQFQQLIQDGGFSKTGLAELHRGKADCLRVADNWQGAIKEYRKAYSLDKQEIFRVFEAECLYENGQSSDALILIDTIDYESLEDDASKNDFIMRFARISVVESDLERLNSAKKILSSKLVLSPFFERQRQTTLINVLNAIDEAKEKPSLTRKRIGLGLSKLSSYVTFQPSIFGFSLNVNKMIEDGLKPKGHKLLDDEKTPEA